MSKKLSTADVAFNKNVKQQMETDERQSEPTFYRWGAANTPIFFPKHKKFKRS